MTTTMSCTSKFFAYVTMISNFFIVNEFFSYPTHVTRLKSFFFFNHDKIFLEMFFHYFLQYWYSTNNTIKNCFNEFKSIPLTFENKNWFTKFIINTNKFVSKTTRNAILIFFLSKSFQNCQHFLNYTQSQHKL